MSDQLPSVSAFEESDESLRDSGSVPSLQRVLLVTDRVRERHVLMSALDSLPVATAFASSKADALRLAEALRPDVVVLDVELEGEGWDTCDALLARVQESASAQVDEADSAGGDEIVTPKAWDPSFILLHGEASSAGSEGEQESVEDAARSKGLDRLLRWPFAVEEARSLFDLVLEQGPMSGPVPQVKPSGDSDEGDGDEGDSDEAEPVELAAEGSGASDVFVDAEPEDGEQAVAEESEPVADAPDTNERPESDASNQEAMEVESSEAGDGQAAEDVDAPGLETDADAANASDDAEAQADQEAAGEDSADEGSADEDSADEDAVDDGPVDEGPAHDDAAEEGAVDGDPGDGDPADDDATDQEGDEDPDPAADAMSTLEHEDADSDGQAADVWPGVPELVPEAPDDEGDDASKAESHFAEAVKLDGVASASQEDADPSQAEATAEPEEQAEELSGDQPDEESKASNEQSDEEASSIFRDAVEAAAWDTAPDDQEVKTAADQTDQEPLLETDSSEQPAAMELGQAAASADADPDDSDSEDADSEDADSAGADSAGTESRGLEDSEDTSEEPPEQPESLEASDGDIEAEAGVSEAEVRDDQAEPESLGTASEDGDAQVSHGVLDFVAAQKDGRAQTRTEPEQDGTNQPVDDASAEELSSSSNQHGAEEAAEEAAADDDTTDTAELPALTDAETFPEASTGSLGADTDSDSDADTDSDAGSGESLADLVGAIPVVQPWQPRGGTNFLDLSAEEPSAEDRLQVADVAAPADTEATEPEPPTEPTTPMPEVDADTLIDRLLVENDPGQEISAQPGSAGVVSDIIEVPEDFVLAGSSHQEDADLELDEAPVLESGPIGMGQDALAPILSDLFNVDGVGQVMLIENEGGVVFTSSKTPQFSLSQLADLSVQLSASANLLLSGAEDAHETDGGVQSIVVEGEHCCILLQTIDDGHRLVVCVESTAGLGQVRFLTRRLQDRLRRALAR